jgi:hypothetical protein
MCCGTGGKQQGHAECGSNHGTHGSPVGAKP